VIRAHVRGAARLFAGALAAAFLVLPLGPMPAGAAATKLLSFEAMRNVVAIDDVQVSPDGTHVAYIRSKHDFKADENATEIELIDVATGTSRALTHERKGIAAIHWSPSGDQLAFVATGEEKTPQLFVLPMNGGDSMQITKALGGVVDFAWQPDGSAFAFASPDVPKPGKPEGYVPAFTVTDEHFLTRTPSYPTLLWTVKSDGGPAKKVPTKYGALSYFAQGGIAFTPDGKSLIAVIQPDAVFAHFVKSQTMRIDLATGAESALVPNTIDHGGPLSHDGSKIALAWPRHGSFYLQNDYSIRSLADGSEVGNGRAIDRNVHSSAWSPDDKTLYVETADGVRDVIWTLGTDGTVQKLDLGDIDPGGPLSIAKDGTIAFAGVSRTRPGEVYVIPAGSGAPKKLSDNNAWLADYQLPQRDVVTWKSDGMTIDGVLTYPVGYTAGKKYPLVLTIHGGPVSTSTWDFNRYDTALTQVLAAQGFLVLEPNYRGSDNSGDAFLQAIVGDVTSGPGKDNLAGVEALKAMGIVDASRIGVGGWSGGGLQTSWLVGHATYWKAAVTGAGVDNWFEQAVLSDINENFSAVFMGGDTPWTAAGRKHYDDESPITYASRIRTPVLILSDIGDQRVPIPQSFELYRALRDTGKTVEFMAWPREGHFPHDPVAVESIFKAWDGWFVRWMK
jgi:dipeptidyl aminopeptidase/acylaminoacyl peptidase